MKYELFNLEITTIGDPKNFNCSHKVGDGLIIEGENIIFKKDTKRFSHYVLASLVPYIAAKQRAKIKSDWMYFEDEINCPDPKCGASFVIKRTGSKEFQYVVSN
jgi:uncharacterized repeat protein (TIGR04076 family)